MSKRRSRILKVTMSSLFKWSQPPKILTPMSSMNTLVDLLATILMLKLRLIINTKLGWKLLRLRRLSKTKLLIQISKLLPLSLSSLSLDKTLSLPLKKKLLQIKVYRRPRRRPLFSRRLLPSHQRMKLRQRPQQLPQTRRLRPLRTNWESSLPNNQVPKKRRKVNLIKRWKRSWLLERPWLKRLTLILKKKRRQKLSQLERSSSKLKSQWDMPQRKHNNQQLLPQGNQFTRSLNQLPQFLISRTKLSLMVRLKVWTRIL